MRVDRGDVVMVDFPFGKGRHILIDVSTESGKASGLWLQSVVNCSQVATIKSDRVARRLGRLSDSLKE